MLRNDYKINHLGSTLMRSKVVDLVEEVWCKLLINNCGLKTMLE
jgi:hypothetical protein